MGNKILKLYVYYNIYFIYEQNIPWYINLGKIDKQINNFIKRIYYFF